MELGNGAGHEEFMQGQAGSHPSAIRALHESHDTWASCAHATADLIFVLDEKGQYIDVLAFHGDPLGRQAEEIKGRHVHDFLPPAVAEPIVAILQEALRLRTPRLLEYPLGPDHDSHWFEGRATPLIDAQGHCTRVLWVARDITARKGTEESLRRTQDDLEGRVRQRTAELARAQVQLRCEITERQRTETCLLEEQRLLRQMVQAYERHRQSIAREIHAGVSQPLRTALSWIESSLKDPSAESTTEPPRVQILQRLHECLRETCEAVDNLHPAILRTNGLPGAIEELIRESNRGSVQVSLAYEVPSQCWHPLLETTIFRLIQEGLSHFLHPPYSDRIELSVRPSGDQLQIRIETRANGPDLAGVAAEERGLAQLQERAQLFDGKASFATTSDGGTCLLITLPLIPPMAGC